jgi:archaeosine synthase
MLEVLGRAFAARRTVWTEGTVTIPTPDILFLDAEDCAAPEYATSLLTRKGDDYCIVTRESEGCGPSFASDRKIPLSQLKFLDYGVVTKGKGTLSVRSPPASLHRLLENTVEEIISMEGAFELRRDPRNLVMSIIALRGKVGSSRLVYAPGIMDPGNLALLCYLGIDLFDSSLLIYQAASGNLTLPELTIPAKDADWLLSGSSRQDVLEFNLKTAWDELRLVRWAIEKGRLRELVETRVNSDPWAVAVLRLFDIEGYDYQEEMAPVVGGSFRCNSKQALHRPDVQRWRNRMMERYLPPDHKEVLLLLPCSARKPYSTSKTHKAFRRVLDSVGKSHMVHEVIVTSPLGLVPRELEIFYPASQYDIPVTGHWDCFEQSMISQLLHHLLEYGYREVICHIDEGFVSEDLDCIVTSTGDPTSRDSLDQLRGKLAGICKELTPVSRFEDRIKTMESVARFQFGEGGEMLLTGAEVSGRHPWSRISEGGKQLGMLSPERGMISLTLEGARKLHDAGINIVRIAEFQLKGNLFAVGVEEADTRIRIGDEAIIVRGDEVVGVGVASMNGREMMELSRGEAVRIRHTS